MINKQAFLVAGVDEKTYRKWCIQNKLPYYKASTAEKFFQKIQEGSLVLDSSGELKKKRPKKGGH